MNKSILVIDTPEKCVDYPICASYAESAFSPREYWCTASENTNVNPYDKPNWCPLNPVPQKLGLREEYPDDFSCGWNACINKITST